MINLNDESIINGMHEMRTHNRSHSMGDFSKYKETHPTSMQKSHIKLHTIHEETTAVKIAKIQGIKEETLKKYMTYLDIVDHKMNFDKVNLQDKLDKAER